MAFDVTAAKKYLNAAREVERLLVDFNRRYLPEQLFDDFCNADKRLEKDIADVENSSRSLRIGVIGQVKAGKSTFLNALLFDEKEYLPTNPTPMTAVLTKVCYGDEMSAKIHFHSAEAWSELVKKAQEFETALSDSYNTYCENYRKQHESAQNVQKSLPPIMSKADYEVGFRTSGEVSESSISAVELIQMVAQYSSAKDKIGSPSIRITGDNLKEQLDDYVGANGKFTPVVNYVELFIKDDRIKDIEIIDTPGLNDPVVSRGVKTKEFLGECDVVILLSNCGQFMDEHTVRMMLQQFPNAGIGEVIVVGSKLDAGVQNELAGRKLTFPQALKKSIDSYRSSFTASMSRLKKAVSVKNLEKVSEDDISFISAIAHTAFIKKKKGMSLNPVEQQMIRQLSGFPGFSESLLGMIGGFDTLRNKLSAVLERKASIIKDKNSSRLSVAFNEHERILTAIVAECNRCIDELKSTDISELEKRSQSIESAMSGCSLKLYNKFENASNLCKQRSQRIIAKIYQAQSKLKRFEVKTTTETKEWETGWIFKKTHYKTTTSHSAYVGPIITNLQEFAGNCLAMVSDEYAFLFDKVTFSHEIVAIILDSFRKVGYKYDEDLILLPLESLLSSMSVSPLTYSYDKYIDRINSEFQSGIAMNKEIGRLGMLYSEAGASICEDLDREIQNNMNVLCNALLSQASTFSDRIKAELIGEVENLKAQIAEREASIAKNTELAEIAKKSKSNLRKELR